MAGFIVRFTTIASANGIQYPAKSLIAYPSAKNSPKAIPGQVINIADINNRNNRGQRPIIIKLEVIPQIQYSYQ